MAYEITVVGARPAGLSFLKNIDNEDVVLIERQKIPRNKPCGGMLVKESIDFLKHVPLSVSAKPFRINLHYIDFDNNILVRDKKKNFY